jgi:hypothetical protein
MSVTGEPWTFSNMDKPGTWEHTILQAVPELRSLEASLAGFLEEVTLQDSLDSSSSSSVPERVEIKRALGVPRYDPVVDVVRGHPAIFGRKKRLTAVDSVAYRAVVLGAAGIDVEYTCFAQVLALGVVGSQEFLFCRNYACPIALSESRWLACSHPTKAADVAKRRCPLTLRPLVWEPARSEGEKKVRFEDSGSFIAISPACLISKVCIVPDYKRGRGNFLVNDLVHRASDDMFTPTSSSDLCSETLQARVKVTSS